MKRSALQLGCLFLAIIVLASFTPHYSVSNSSQTASKPAPKKVRVKSFSCPTANDFHLEYVDFGWTGGSCYYSHITEVYIVFHGSSFTNPVEIEFEVTDDYPWGSYAETYWQAIYPGNTRVYVGQNQEQWNDNNCNGVQDWDEMQYHTWTMTGNSHCL